jgi:hypothetical protein
MVLIITDFINVKFSFRLLSKSVETQFTLSDVRPPLSNKSSLKTSK